MAHYSLVPRVSLKQNDIGEIGEVGHLAYPGCVLVWFGARGAGWAGAGWAVGGCDTKLTNLIPKNLPNEAD